MSRRSLLSPVRKFLFISKRIQLNGVMRNRRMAESGVEYQCSKFIFVKLDPSLHMFGQWTRSLEYGMGWSELGKIHVLVYDVPVIWFQMFM